MTRSIPRAVGIAAAALMLMTAAAVIATATEPLWAEGVPAAPGEAELTYEACMARAEPGGDAPTRWETAAHHHTRDAGRVCSMLPPRPAPPAPPLPAENGGGETARPQTTPPPAAVPLPQTPPAPVLAQPDRPPNPAEPWTLPHDRTPEGCARWITDNGWNGIFPAELAAAERIAAERGITLLELQDEDAQWDVCSAVYGAPAPTTTTTTAAPRELLPDQYRFYLEGVRAGNAAYPKLSFNWNWLGKIDYYCYDQGEDREHHTSRTRGYFRYSGFIYWDELIAATLAECEPLG